MFSSSIILESFIKLNQKFKTAYSESYINYILNRIWQWFSRLLKGSVIIQFMCGNIRLDKSLKESFIFKFFKKIKRLTINAKDALVKLFQSSLILSFLIENNGEFYIFLLAFALIPFIPTFLMLILCLGIIGLTLIRNIVKGNKVEYPKMYLFFLILFIVSIIISAIFNSGPAKSREVFIIYFIIVNFGLFVPYIINDKKKVLLFTKVLAFVTLILCFYGFYQFIFGAPMDEAWIDKDFGNNITRVYSVFGNPNVYGEYLVLVIPIIFALFNISENKLSKFIYFIIMAFAVANVFMTLSRGSMVGLAISIIILVLLKAHKYLPAVIALAFIAPPLLPESIIRRILTIFTRKDTSSTYRKSIYRASINILKDNPITGIGLGQFKEIYKIYSLNAAKSFHAHNTLLMVFIEMGALGIFSFIAMLIAWTRNIFSTLKYKASQMSFIAISIFAGIVGCSIQGLVDHIWHNYNIMLMYFILLGIGCASASLAGDEGVGNNEQN